MKFSTDEQALIRKDIFRWLDEKQVAGKFEFSREDLSNYTWFGQRIRLVSTQKGIWNPAQFDETLSILTSFENPYDDVHDDEIFVRYKYQEREGGDNLKLKAAFRNQIPLIYFRAMRPSYYVAHYPVFVVEDDEKSREFVISLAQDLQLFADPLGVEETQRKYVERMVRTRVHQPEFRWNVMKAYQETCAVCNLKHVELLDAAHIIPDSDSRGRAVVTNGLSLCKIHHAAYDKNLIGISPDYEVRVNDELLQEVDGPMLKHGIQEMHNRHILLPKDERNHPERDNLAFRFAEFLK